MIMSFTKGNLDYITFTIITYPSLMKWQNREEAVSWRQLVGNWFCTACYIDLYVDCGAVVYLKGKLRVLQHPLKSRLMDVNSINQKDKTT